MANHSLLADIEAFTATHGMAESTFGREALGDWRFIAEMRGDGGRKPRRLWPETEAKVRRFMSTYRAPAKDDRQIPAAPAGSANEAEAA